MVMSSVAEEEPPDLQISTTVWNVCETTLKTSDSPTSVPILRFATWTKTAECKPESVPRALYLTFKTLLKTKTKKQLQLLSMTASGRGHGKSQKGRTLTKQLLGTSSSSSSSSSTSPSSTSSSTMSTAITTMPPKDLTTRFWNRPKKLRERPPRHKKQRDRSLPLLTLPPVPESSPVLSESEPEPEPSSSLRRHLLLQDATAVAASKPSTTPPKDLPDDATVTTLSSHPTTTTTTCTSPNCFATAANTINDGDNDIDNDNSPVITPKCLECMDREMLVQKQTNEISMLKAAFKELATSYATTLREKNQEPILPSSSSAEENNVPSSPTSRHPLVHVPKALIPQKVVHNNSTTDDATTSKDEIKKDDDENDNAYVDDNNTAPTVPNEASSTSGHDDASKLESFALGDDTSNSSKSKRKAHEAYSKGPLHTHLRRQSEASTVLDSDTFDDNTITTQSSFSTVGLSTAFGMSNGVLSSNNSAAYNDDQQQLQQQQQKTKSSSGDDNSFPENSHPPCTSSSQSSTKTQRPLKKRVRNIRVKIQSKPALYSGPVVDMVPHGIGVIRFDDGDIYLGKLERGIMEGNGSLYRKDGTLLRGDFTNGVLEGPGTNYLILGPVE